MIASTYGKLVCLSACEKQLIPQFINETLHFKESYSLIGQEHFSLSIYPFEIEKALMKVLRSCMQKKQNNPSSLS